MAEQESLRTDEAYEKQHIEETLSVIADNCRQYRKSLEEMKETIESLDSTYKEETGGVFRSGDAATWLQMSNTISMYESTKLQLGRNERAEKKPYFGRIILTETQEGASEGSSDETVAPESFYIGRGAINKALTDQVVIDWRAPIANVYYENGIGKCSFDTPTGEKLTVDLSLKRTFDIADGKLQGYFDSEVAANDELLNKYLAKNKQAVLGEIIATIQKEQNDIIRKSPLHNVLVQGVAGSGKTTVAMHRISYILYNYADRIKPADFYIIGSNRMLLNYITGVLPELDVSGFMQMTMEQMFVRLLYNDWDPLKYGIKEIDPKDTTASQRGSTKWFELLDKYLDEYELSYFEGKVAELHKPSYMKFKDYKVEVVEGTSEDSMHVFNDLYLNPLCFREGIEKGKSGVYDRSDEKEPVESDCKCILKAAKLAGFIKENKALSMKRKEMTLGEWISDNIENELLHKDVSYTAREKEAVKRRFEGFFGKKNHKESAFAIYDEFLNDMKERKQYAETRRMSDSVAALQESVSGERKKKGFDVYDLAALAYIYKRIVEEEEISEAHHIVVDEAQDYGMMAYRVLNFCVKDCKYTIMGDVSQNIRYESGINDWQELKELMVPNERDSFSTLRKSYRNTIEISEFATSILEHGTFEIYPVEPIIRHGKEPEIMKVAADSAASRVINVCKRWQKDGLETIAVVCRDNAEAEHVREMLGGKIELLDTDPEKAEFGAGIMVLPVSMTKGLEFDAVLIYNPSRKSYPSDDTNVKLLYVAATRALHELAVVYFDDLTGLIADDISELRRTQLEEYTARQQAADREREARMNAIPVDTTYDEEREREYLKAKILKESAEKTRKYLEGRNTESTGSVGSLRSTESISGTRKPEGAATRSLTASKREEGSFASIVPSEELEVAGHAIINQAVKWTIKQQDGVYFQSRYGVLRVCPIGKSAVRISFMQGSEMKMPENGMSKRYAMFKGYRYSEKGNMVEIAMPELVVVVDKLNGSLTFRDGKGKELLAERKTEPRYVTPDGRYCYTYLNVNSADSFIAYDMDGDEKKYLHNTAYYVTPDGGKPAYILKKEKYGLFFATKGKTVFCQKAGFGTFAKTEGSFLDMYFVTSTDTQKLLDMYKKLLPD